MFHINIFLVLFSNDFNKIKMFFLINFNINNNWISGFLYVLGCLIFSKQFLLLFSYIF